MVIQHNLAALNSQNQLKKTTKYQASLTEHLSSGYRVNRAADDAAGLTISEKMRSQIRGLTQASLNAHDGISMVQIAEGALGEVQDMLQRMNELTIKCANGTNTAQDRDAIQDEVNELLGEIDRVATSTEFNTLPLLTYSDEIPMGYVQKKFNAVFGKSFDVEYNIEDRTLSLNGDQDKLKTLYDNMLSDDETMDKLQGIATYVKNLQGEDGAGQFSIGEPENGKLIVDFSEVIFDMSVPLQIGATNHESDVLLVKRQEINTTNLGIAGLRLHEEQILDQEEIGRVWVPPHKIPAYTIPAHDVPGTPGKIDVSKGGQANTPGTPGYHVPEVHVPEQDVPGRWQPIYRTQKVDQMNYECIDQIRHALDSVSEKRSYLGAVQNRLEHTIKNLDNVVENTTAAESSIRDADMAKEMVQFANSNILSQAGQSMLAQANQSKQGILQLLS